MSRLAELIEDLCPDGVEYRALGDVGVFVRGGGLQKADFVEAGMPCVHYGQIHTRFGISTTMAVSSVSEAQFARLKHADYGDLLIATTSEDDEAVGKATAWLGEGEVAISGDMFYYRHNLEPKYVSYFFASSSFQEQKRPYLTGAKVRRIADKGLSRIQIPVPPLEVQREIVRILDQFTTLEAELEAELEARRTQYEHYRNDLLSYESLAAHGPVEMVKLGDVVEMHRGSGMPKTSFVSSGIPALHYGHIFTRYSVSTSVAAAYVSRDDASKLATVMPGDLVLANTSENLDDVGKAVVWKGGEAAVAGGHATVISSELLDMAFLSHYVRSSHFSKSKRKFAQGTKVIELSAVNLAKIPMVLPELSEQRRIADLLDRFDVIVNDISSGLPAEIEARRTQYEHYRERLLSFPEKQTE
jgi:restriction modification system DNA specificity domain protein